MRPSLEEAVEFLDSVRELMGLAGENVFKLRAFEKVAKLLPSLKIEDLRTRAENGTLVEIAGIGKGIAETLTPFLLKGDRGLLETLKADLPKGLLELTQLSGLGPKKARVLIEELGIHSLGELEYACRENRLVKLEGFGEKTQAKYLKALQYLSKNRGKLRLDQALEVWEKLRAQIAKELKGLEVLETGELRRRCEVVESIEVLAVEPTAAQAKKLASLLTDFRATEALKVPLRMHEAPAIELGRRLIETTGSAAHLKALELPSKVPGREETDVYRALKVEWIAPEFRETGEEVRMARTGALTDVVTDVQGVFHNHTTRSDGTASLRDMVKAAQKLGYKYFGISDHSQSAFYASGLKHDALKEQEREVRELQEDFPDIRVFWGIESDILKDGSLDYEPALLKRFDFVIGSIHSRFGMEGEPMTERILAAIRNPHLRMIGHLTGRLLLDREGFDTDVERIIREAASHDVAIEINANPARLDIDWRHGPALRKHGTKVSINPDAHSTEGLEDTRFGVWMARKALLPSKLVINTRPVREVEAWLKRK